MLISKKFENDLKRENRNIQEDGAKIDTHHTSKNGR